MDADPLTSFLIGGVAVLVLVAANAFFVAAEFALVASRRTRVATMAQRGHRGAKLAHRAIKQLDKYISATQLGITLASLGLGWIGEPAIATVLEAWFAALPAPFDVVATHGVATAIAFAFITFLHIVLGELAPKALAIVHPEATSVWVAGPLIVFTVATNPFIWFLNGAANLILRLFGMRTPQGHERVHRPEEIVMLAKQSQEHGQLASRDVRLIEGVFEFSEKTARDVMTPRTEVQALEAEMTVEEAVARAGEVGRSRYPVFVGSLDEIVGVVHVKQLLSSLSTARYQKLSAIVGEPLFVPGTREIEDLLADMQRLNQHFAVVLDEYGGTAGIVTMEDLLEEIVGLIYDEYDRPEDETDSMEDGTTIPGNLEIEVANDRYALGLEVEEYHTIGGYVFGKLGRLPRVGDSVPVGHGRLEVAEMDGRRVGKLSIRRSHASGERAIR